jgi:hypothetical protein
MFFVRINILFFVFSFCSIQVKSQTKNVYVPGNSSIKFVVVRKSSELTSDSTFIPVTYLIKTNISNKERELVKKINKKRWIKFLTNEKTDWAANLILYDINKKDAISYASVIKNREDWLIVGKSKDLEYWEKKLK